MRPELSVGAPLLIISTAVSLTRLASGHPATEFRLQAALQIGRKEIYKLSLPHGETHAPALILVNSGSEH
jgi:hypothetical protein